MTVVSVVSASPEYFWHQRGTKRRGQPAVLVLRFSYLVETKTLCAVRRNLSTVYPSPKGDADPSSIRHDEETTRRAHRAASFMTEASWAASADRRS